MEAKENKISGIYFDGPGFLLATLNIIISERLGIRTEDIDIEKSEAGRQLYEKICNEAGDIITDNFRKWCANINPKDDTSFYHVFRNSIIVEDENHDNWFCAPLINLNALYDKYCPKNNK